VPGIESIEITAKLRQKLVPLPEGSSYLGFIFARGDSPQYVEAALREAHRKLRFIISSSIPVL
jgi:L-amino acid ligase C-terminal domain 2